MSNEPFDGTIEFSLASRPLPWKAPADYCQTVVGRARSAEGLEVGKISMQLICTSVAENDEQSLMDIFDTNSLLKAIYATLFDEDENAKEELEIEPIWSNLLFIEKFRVRNGYERTAIAVEMIETGSTMFCHDGLVIAIEDSLDLTMEDWRNLGFKRIASSPFVFREQLKRNPYDSHERLSDEAVYICDGCGEEIVIPIDMSQGEMQEYVEDCPICCQANVIHIEIDEDGQVSAWAEPEQDYD